MASILHAALPYTYVALIDSIFYSAYFTYTLCFCRSSFAVEEGKTVINAKYKM